MTRATENEASGAVDAVVTWVDGSDPAHREKRLAHLAGAREPGTDTRGLRETRFEQSGEIAHCLRLIRRHAPWIRTIFLVTDDQRPAWLDAARADALGVTVVDHTVIFEGFESYLPTFSSRSIETLLYRIPGLADRFVYFNDDVFLVNAVTPETWFDGDRCLMRGRWQTPLSLPKKLVREARRSIARHAPGSTFRDGFSARRGERFVLPSENGRHFALAHAPFPVHTPFMRAVIGEAGLHTNARHRFRHVRQLNPMAYMAHLGLDEGVVVPGPDDWEYVSCGEHSARVVAHRLRRCATDPSVKSLCVQSLERAQPNVRRRVEDFLGQAAGGRAEAS